MRRKLAAGNWKMNGVRHDLTEIEAIADAQAMSAAELLICPPATLLAEASARTVQTGLALGGQDCHSAVAGAHTGDISAPMLAEAGASYVIVGHSERREDHEETDSTVRAKARAAQSNGLTAVVCMGESLAEREAENTLDIIAGQLAGSIPDASDALSLVIAYEPIWAIGTGLVPTLDQIAEVHDFIRARMIRRFGQETGAHVRILYGGSVKPSNASDIFTVDNVDGALVGGASLTAADFLPIVEALNAF